MEYFTIPCAFDADDGLVVEDGGPTVDLRVKTGGYWSSFVSIDAEGAKRLIDALVAKFPDVAPKAAVPADLAKALREWADRHSALGNARRMRLAPLSQRLFDLAMALLKPEPDLSGYRSECPQGFDTVLHYLVKRDGLEAAPEDMGLRAGFKAAAKAKGCRTAPTIWVAAPAALEGVCKQVRAYPEDFLREVLG